MKKKSLEGKEHIMDHPMTQNAEEKRRRPKSLRCVSTSDQILTEGMTVNDESCSIYKVFFGYFLAVAMAFFILLVYLWFKWGRKSNKDDIIMAVTTAVKAAMKESPSTLQRSASVIQSIT